MKLTRPISPWPYAVMYSLLAIVALVYERLSPAGVWGIDTPSYIEAGEALFNGTIHAERTPVYPLFICAITRFMSLFTDPSHALKTVMMAQWCIFFIAVHYVRLSLKQLLPDSKKWVLAGTVLFAFNPMIWQFNNCHITESLAVSVTVFLIWSTISVVREPGVLPMIRMFMWVTVALFLRPSFLYLLPLDAILLLAMALRTRRHRKALICGITCLGVCVACVLAYCHENYRQNGVRAMSFTGSINAYFTLREAGIVHPDSCADRLMSEALRRNLNPHNTAEYADALTWPEIRGIMREVPKSEIEAYIGSEIAAHKKEVLELIWRRTTVYLAAIPMIDLTTYMNRIPMALPWPTNFTELAATVLATLWFIFLLIRRRRFPIAIPWLIGLVSGQFAVVLAGAQDEYNRLLLPCIPAWTILMIVTAHSIKQTINDTRSLRVRHS